MIGNGRKLENVAPFDVDLFRAESASWPLVPAVAICPNPLCSFKEPTPIELRHNADGVFRCQCGVCGATNDLYQPAI